MAKDPKEKGKKKKGGQDEPKAPRISLPRRSKTSTRDRAENRKATHERRAKRKTARLAAKCEALETLLNKKGVECRCVDGESTRARYKRLWRQARRHGLAGTPIKRKRKAPEALDKPVRQTPVLPENPQVPETTA